MKLTDEQIKLVCRTGMWDDSWQSVQFARAIEAEVLRLNGGGGEAVPYSGADESPPVFGRRWSTHPDGFGFKRNDVDGNYVHIDDALSVLHQWQQEAERNEINFCKACSVALCVPQPQQAAPGAVLEGWIPVEQQMPKSGQIVLALQKWDHSGMLGIIRAAWVAAKTEESSHESDMGEYDETTDTYYDPEGWYEQIAHWDEYSAAGVSGATIVAWMPLPAVTLSAAPKPQGE